MGKLRVGIQRGEAFTAADALHLGCQIVIVAGNDPDDRVARGLHLRGQGQQRSHGRQIDGGRLVTAPCAYDAPHRL